MCHPPTVQLKISDCQENRNPLGRCFPPLNSYVGIWKFAGSADTSWGRLALRLPTDESFSALYVKGLNPMFLYNLILKLNPASQF